MEEKEGGLSSKFKTVTLVLHGFTLSELQTLQVNSIPQTASEQNIRFFTSHFKFADYGPFDFKKVIEVSIQNADNKIVIHW